MLPQSPYIVDLIEVYETPRPSGRSEDKDIYMLFELCPGGNLVNFIESKSKHGHSRLTEQEDFQIVADIVHGLGHLHL